MIVFNLRDRSHIDFRMQGVVMALAGRGLLLITFRKLEKLLNLKPICAGEGSVVIVIDK